MTRFQDIYNNPKEKERFLFDNGKFFSILDAFPINPGHSLIIPVKPIVSIFDLDEEQLLGLRDAIRQTKDILTKCDLTQYHEDIIKLNISATSVTFCEEAISMLSKNKNISGYNIGNNDGRDAGRTIDHLHIHLIPRYSGDVESPEGGVRHMFPGKGFYR